MNNMIQNILVTLALVLAVAFLVKKFMPKKANSNKSCGHGDNCGCN
jgi:flagellar biogenesis protein FliO